MNLGRGYFVYMMQSPSRHALYIGVTNDLERRVYEHRQHLRSGFSDTYNTIRLVYFERFNDIRSAIDRETQLKHWRRNKKEYLIQQMNPHWDDLAEGWGQQFKPTDDIGARPIKTWGGSTTLRSARHDNRINLS